MYNVITTFSLEIAHFINCHRKLKKNILQYGFTVLKPSSGYLLRLYQKYTMCAITLNNYGKLHWVINIKKNLITPFRHRYTL